MVVGWVLGMVVGMVVGGVVEILVVVGRAVVELNLFSSAFIVNGICFINSH